MSLYNEDWFRRRERFRPWLTRAAAELYRLAGPFASVLDLGAGDGWLAHCLGQLHAGRVALVAVEISDAALPVMPPDVEGYVHDLTTPLDLMLSFELVLCIEVAEHLPASAAETLCDTIARHCGGLLAFSAAAPGQPGVGHINCQPAAYWRALLADRGLVYLPGLTNLLRRRWLAALEGHMPWLPQNVMLFKAGG